MTGSFKKRLLLLALVLTTAIALPTAAFADYHDEQGIFYVDKNASVCGGPSSNVSLNGDDNASKIWDWLVNQNGMSQNGAAGIMGNMQPESGFNPFRIQGKGENGTGALRTYDAMVNSDASNSAFGLVQWDGGRRPAVLKYITNGHDEYKQYVSDQYGKDVDSYINAPTSPVDVNDTFITLELEYMKQESTPGGGRPTVWDAMIQANSPGDAADTFEEIFEGSTRNPGGEQHTDAEEIYTRFTGNSPSTTSTTSATSTCGSTTTPTTITEGGLTEEQAKTLVINYGTDAGGSSTKAVLAGPGTPSSGCAGGLLSNCTSFSAFFINKFTSDKFQGGNGNEVVDNLAASGVPTGSTPKVYAVFSVGDSGNGHTGVILGIHGNTVIVGEASCSSPGSGPGDGLTYGKGAAVIVSGDINSAAPYYVGVPTKYAYPRNVNVQAVQEYLGGISL
jgi:hypothetical protein